MRNTFVCGCVLSITGPTITSPIPHSTPSCYRVLHNKLHYVSTILLPLENGRQFTNFGVLNRDGKSLAYAQSQVRCLLLSPAMRLTQEWLNRPRDVHLRFRQVSPPSVSKVILGWGGACVACSRVRPQVSVCN